jgi:hypothetical protein
MGNNLIQRKDSDLRRRVKAGNSTATLKIRNNDGNLRGLVPVPGAGEVSIDEIAANKFAQPDPAQRFEGLQATILELLICSLDKISDETANRAHHLLQMMDEAGQGDYSNATWPPKKSQGRGRRRLSFDRSRGFGCIVALTMCRHKLDDLDDQEIGLACSRAAHDIDKALKPRRISLADWLPSYNPSDDGDRKKGRKTTPRKLIDRKECDGSTRFHDRTWQLKSYTDKNTPPSLDDPDSAGSQIHNLCLAMIAQADKCPKPEDRKTVLRNLYVYIRTATVRAIIESWPR